MQILRETGRRGWASVVLGSTALVALLTAASPAGAVVTRADSAAQPAGASAASSSAFTFAVIPDTQRETKSTTDPRFADRTNWLVRNKQALNLQFAIQVGDLVDWDTPDHHMYRTAWSAMDVLHDARIPYTIAPGNHDTAAVCPGGSACDVTTTTKTVRDTSTLNAFFQKNDLRKVKEQFEPNKIDNTYSRYRIGGREWGC